MSFSKDPPEDFVRDLRHLMQPGCGIKLTRHVRRGTYRDVHRMDVGQYPIAESFHVAQVLYQKALDDIAKHPGEKYTFKVTFDYASKWGARGQHYRKAKHFQFFPQGEEPAQQVQVKLGFDCDDCKDTGWYIGLVERRKCPTCKG